MKRHFGKLLVGVFVCALFAGACSSSPSREADIADDGDRTATPAAAPSASDSADVDDFVALMRQSGLRLDYDAFQSVEEVIRASDLIVRGEIIAAETGRSLLQSPDADESSGESVIFRVAVTEVLGGQHPEWTDDNEILVESFRDPRRSVEDYSSRLPRGLPVLLALTDYTILRQGYVRVNDQRHVGQRILAPFVEGFVVRGGDGRALDAITGANSVAAQIGITGFDQLTDVVRAEVARISDGVAD